MVHLWDGGRVGVLYRRGAAVMILIALIGILLAAGVIAWLSSHWSTELPRWISLIAAVVDLILAARIWFGGGSSRSNVWFDEVNWNWIPSFGIHFHLGVDGLSLLMLILTFFLGIMAVLASWTEIRERVGFFHFNLMWVLAGIAGVFLALDLFLPLAILVAVSIPRTSMASENDERGMMNDELKTRNTVRGSLQRLTKRLSF
jgi:NADH:ubiquinone oxidoreductase subunit 4 (subunit M)